MVKKIYESFIGEGIMGCQSLGVNVETPQTRPSARIPSAGPEDSSASRYAREQNSDTEGFLEGSKGGEDIDHVSRKIKQPLVVISESD